MVVVAPPRLVDDYLGWLATERGRAQNTLTSYSRDLQEFVGFCTSHKRSLDDVDEQLILQWLAFTSATGRKANSRARALTAVRGLFRFGVDEGLLSADPTAAVEAPKTAKILPKALSEDEVQQILNSVVGEDPGSRRDRAILEVLYSTGMRVSELVGLNVQDIDVVPGFARVTGKGSKQRLVPIGSFARKAIGEWTGLGGRPSFVPAKWARKGDSEAVFLNARGGRLSRQGVWLIIEQRCERVGLREVASPHVFRHSCATHMLAHGADLRVVQELLGHASVVTTEIYTKVTNERMALVYAQAHPRASYATWEFHLGTRG